jgi:hypothetical protein
MRVDEKMIETHPQFALWPLGYSNPPARIGSAESQNPNATKSKILIFGI